MGGSGPWGASSQHPFGADHRRGVNRGYGHRGTAKLALEENLITKAEYDEAKRTFPMAQRGQIMEGVKASLVLKKKLLEH